MRRSGGFPVVFGRAIELNTHMHLANARVWLTGASSGIGEALVAPLVRRGARVAITARRTGRLDAIAARYAAGGASAVLAVRRDMTDRAAEIGSAHQIENAWGEIDLAIFNAGGSVDHDRQSAVEGGETFRSDSYTATMPLNMPFLLEASDAAERIVRGRIMTRFLRRARAAAAVAPRR